MREEPGTTERRPRYCPACAAPLDGDNAVVEVDDDSERYDCYCAACGWSGDIAPYVPLGPRDADPEPSAG